MYTPLRGVLRQHHHAFGGLTAPRSRTSRRSREAIGAMQQRSKCQVSAAHSVELTRLIVSLVVGQLVTPLTWTVASRRSAGHFGEPIAFEPPPVSFVQLLTLPHSCASCKRTTVCVVSLRASCGRVNIFSVFSGCWFVREQEDTL